MTTTLQPQVSQWYRHLDKGQQFYVTAIDDDESTVEIQHFDGDLEEIDLEDWRQLHLETVAPPEDWTGPVDDIERDDLGYSETAMTEEDWDEALDERVQFAERTGEEEE